jgi:hypothetical protein
MCGAGDFLLATDSGEAVSISESLAHAFWNVTRIYWSFRSQEVPFRKLACCLEASLVNLQPLQDP